MYVCVSISLCVKHFPFNIIQDHLLGGTQSCLWKPKDEQHRFRQLSCITWWVINSGACMTPPPSSWRSNANQSSVSWDLVTFTSHCQRKKKNNSILLFILCVACKCRGGGWGSLCSGLAPLFNVNVKVSRISLPTLAACLKQWLTCFTGNICVSECVCVCGGGLNRGCVCDV